MADISQVRVNNTDYNFADDTKVPYDLLQDTVGFTSKNLIPFPYDEYSKSNAGITYTINSDGSIVANGTATGQSRFYLFLHSHGKLVDGGKEYIISGAENVGNNIEFAIALFKGDTYVNKLYLQKNVTNEVKFQVDSTVDYDGADVYILIPNGVTVSNFVFRPMLRKAGIMDSTYEPYNPSVKQVLRNNKIIEGKNLNKRPYHSRNSLTTNGVTFVVNSDGSVTANGTATALASFDCHMRYRTDIYNDKNPLILSNGKYIATGCPAGGGGSKYRILFAKTTGGNPSDYGYDEGNGFELNLQGDDQSANSVQLTVRCQIENGYTANNITFYPMIRKATETDPTYEPYYIPGVVSQEAQNILGAKNLLPYPYKETTLTRNGITFTDNGDGSITVNGTATSDAMIALSDYLTKEQFDALNILNIPLIISKGNLESQTGVWINGYNNTTYVKSIGITQGSNNTESQPFIVDFNGYNRVQFGLNVATGKTVSNVKYYPMLRLADVEDDTWTPYAKTNRELTKMLTPVISDLQINSDYSAYFQANFGAQKVVKMGNFCEIIVDDFNCIEAFTMPSWKQLFYNLPKVLVNSGIQGIFIEINRDKIIHAQYDNRSDNPTGNNTWGLSFTESYNFAVGDKMRFHLMFICDD